MNSRQSKNETTIHGNDRKKARLIQLFSLTIGMAIIFSALAYGWAEPPKDQTYVGAKSCGGCHFEQYMIWKKCKHAVTLDTLPEKYKTDPKCLACHTTGYGTASGYKDSSTPALAGVTCESCHGPGSEHDKIAQQFKGKKNLAPDEEKQIRGSIVKMIPGGGCATCHADKAHKQHPKFEK